MLSRWETQGGQWRVVNETEAWLTVGLVSCDGEEVSRVTGARTAVLTAFLDGWAAELAVTQHPACTAGAARPRGTQPRRPEEARPAGALRRR